MRGALFFSVAFFSRSVIMRTTLMACLAASASAAFLASPLHPTRARTRECAIEMVRCPFRLMEEQPDQQFVLC